MGTDVRVEVEIACPRAAVAAFMFDPRNDATWTSGVVAVRPLDDGRLKPGARVVRTAQFLGRRFDYQYEVAAAEGDQFVEMTVEQPFPMQIRYELSERGAGATLATIHARGDARGFFRLAAPLLNGMVRRNIRKDLQNLKRACESRR